MIATAMPPKPAKKRQDNTKGPERLRITRPPTSGLCKIPDAVSPDMLLSAAPLCINELAGYCYDMTPKQLDRFWVAGCTNALAEELISRNLIGRREALGLVSGFATVLRIVRERLIDKPKQQLTERQ